VNIARGSLAETQYFVHVASRLGYLSDTTTARLTAQGRQAFACLHGLIRAVEKETGILREGGRDG
jgi:four helix bundle protein